jgi:beta-xylosidase
MKAIANPILRGFNPDPSIVRAGRDFHIATSTFEWFPACKYTIRATSRIGASSPIR